MEKNRIADAIEKGERLEAALMELAARFFGIILFRHVVDYVCAFADNPCRTARRLINRLLARKFIVRRPTQIPKLELFAVTDKGVVLAEQYGIEVPVGCDWGTRRRESGWAAPGTVQHDLTAFDFLLQVEQAHRHAPEMLANWLDLPRSAVEVALETASEFELQRVDAKPKEEYVDDQPRKRPDGLIRLGGKIIAVEVERAPKYGAALRRLGRAIMEISQSRSHSMVMPTRDGEEIEVTPNRVVLVLSHIKQVGEKKTNQTKARVIKAVNNQLEAQLADQFEDQFGDHYEEEVDGEPHFSLGVGQDESFPGLRANPPRRLFRPQCPPALKGRAHLVFIYETTAGRFGNAEIHHLTAASLKRR